MATYPDPVTTDGALAPQTASVARPVDERETAARVRADAQMGIVAPYLEQGRQEPVHETRPTGSHRTWAVGRQPERDPGEHGRNLGVGWRGSRHRPGRAVSSLPPNQVPDACEPAKCRPGWQSVGDRHAVIHQVRARLPRVPKVIVIRPAGDRTGMVVAARPMPRVCHAEEIIRPALPR
ncbi:MAG: hypothetical protein HW391_1077 [Chloroflexi bacterium]|nr:hypothetical protein [Chloroflexota bacterium]